MWTEKEHCSIDWPRAFDLFAGAGEFLEDFSKNYVEYSKKLLKFFLPGLIL
jgi:hypothetical protein